MQVEWSLVKARGYYAPYLRVSVTLEPWERKLGIGEVRLEIQGRVAVLNQKLALELMPFEGIGLSLRDPGYAVLQNQMECGRQTVLLDLSGFNTLFFVLPFETPPEEAEAVARYIATVVRDRIEQAICEAVLSGPIEASGVLSLSERARDLLAPYLVEQRLAESNSEV